MRSAIWSTFACMTPPAGCGLLGRAGARRISVVGGEHRDEGRECGGEPAVVEGLLWRVGKLLAHDPCRQHGPVALDVVHVDVAPEQAGLLHRREPVEAALVQLDCGGVSLRARPETG